MSVMPSPDQSRILVVDDNDAGRFIKTQILARAGYRVTEARTGAEALALATAEPPALVVLDVNLPDMSGLDVCRQLKASPASPTIQVLQVSQTAVTEADRARGLDEGADMYLIEPFGATVLLATVRALLRARRAEADLEDALRRERDARAEAERANRMKDEFVAMVSHELRTPLNAMTGWIWQLKNGALDEDSYDRAIDVLDRNARVQTQLINDLLDVSRISAGKVQVELRPVALQQVVKVAVDNALDAPSHKRKSIALTFEAPPDPVPVMGDAARLQQVVTNVLNNAFQFTPAGGRIHVTCGVEQTTAFIRVRDTGVGIDPAFLPHVFERFRQARAMASGPERGLGLGLAIVQYLIELHHGRVRLESDGVGHGTTCEITLPRLDAGVPLVIGPAPISRSILMGLDVLLVEDDADARDVLESLLRRYGASVVTTASVDEAERHAESATFDVLVSDVGLPDASGSELVRRLRARGRTMPAIAVTAFATDADRRRLIAEGFHAHVAKPVDPDVLARAIADAVPGHGTTRPHTTGHK